MKAFYLLTCILALPFTSLAQAEETTSTSVNTATSTSQDTWTLHRKRFPRVKTGSATGTSSGTATKQ